MDIKILADARFGWIFVISEIVFLYSLFLIIHRIVERKLRK